MERVLEVLRCGSLKLLPYVVMGDDSKVKPDYITFFGEGAKTAQMSAEIKGEFRDNLYFTYDGDEIICRRVFENLSDDDLEIAELGVSISGINFGENPRDDYFYHNENPRIYEVMTFPVDYRRTAEDAKDSEFDIATGNRWADPGVICDRIGASPYQPFPAVLISNYNTEHGIVHGSLSQRVFFHNYLINHEENCVKLEILSSFKATKCLKVKGKRCLIDEWYLGATDEAANIEKIFEKYTKVLRTKLPVGYGRSDANRSSLVWGTWNDGVFRNVSEDMILREAKFLKKNFPALQWIQLDDGYAVYNKAAFGLGVPYEGESGIDKDKFPHGLRYVTDKVRSIGLRSALWIGGICNYDTKIYKDHPEWFLDYSYRMESGVLDVSIPEVREYMKKALSVLVEEYGFEAVKHDFWSYAFEDSSDLYKNNDKSGYELREWWLKELRHVLPNDGYLQTGCDIVMGNPFLGEYFTNYRYGIDIGRGNWDYVKTNYLWGTACFSLHTGDMFVPNSDSVGLFPDLNETEAMFCINYCLVTHSMVEIAGLLSTAKDKERLKILKKAVCNPNNGQDVYFADYDYRKNYYCVPEVMYFKTPHFSKIEGNDLIPLRTVGMFNVEDGEKEIGFTVEGIELAENNYLLYDVWSGKQYDLKDTFSANIPGHGSRLFAVCLKGGNRLIDANIRINSAESHGNSLFIETDYESENAELYFSKEPKSIKFNGADADFKIDGGYAAVKNIKKGTFEVIFRD